MESAIVNDITGNMKAANEHVKYLSGHTAYARWLYEVGHNPVGWVVPREHEHCQGEKCGCRKPVSVFRGHLCFVEMPAFSSRYRVMSVNPSRIFWLNHKNARKARQEFSA